MSIILLEEAKPLIRHAQLLTIADGAAYGTAKAYDHRIFLCVGGRGEINVANTPYTMQPGALLLWGPSLPYHYVPDAESPMTLLGFNFDFTRQSAHKTMAIPPAKCGSFDPSLVTEHVTVSDTPYFNKPLYLTNLLHLSARFSEIKDEFLLKKRYFSHRCSALFSDLLALLAREAERPATAASHTQADAIIAYIQEHYHMPLSNALLGQIFGYHPGYIGRLMIEATGTSTHQYLLQYRIARAIDLLQSGEANVSQVCYRCGFGDLAHFSKCFKAKTGRPPSDYLR